MQSLLHLQQNCCQSDSLNLLPLISDNHFLLALLTWKSVKQNTTYIEMDGICSGNSLQTHSVHRISPQQQSCLVRKLGHFKKPWSEAIIDYKNRTDSKSTAINTAITCNSNKTANSLCLALLMWAPVYLCSSLRNSTVTYQYEICRSIQYVGNPLDYTKH